MFFQLPGLPSVLLSPTRQSNKRMPLNVDNQPLAGSRDPEAVRAMFGAIAQRYDLANHTLSCGCDSIWRRRAAAIVVQWNPAKIVDLATGTGDLAFSIQRALPKSEVLGVDFSEEMLALARAKGVQQTKVGDVLALPFPDRAFDCVTISFGLRNVNDWAAALREMARILTPNGHLLVLEFSLPQSSLLRAAYRFYLHRLVPLVGSFLTR